MAPANDPDGAVYNYHYGMDSNGKIQFYSVVTFNADSTTPPSSGDPAPDEPLKDELVDWVSDPYNSNQTPAWGWVGYELVAIQGICRRIHSQVTTTTTTTTTLSI